MAITTYDLKKAFDMVGKPVVPSRSVELLLKNAGFSEQEIADALNNAIRAGTFNLDANNRLSRS